MIWILPRRPPAVCRVLHHSHELCQHSCRWCEEPAPPVNHHPSLPCSQSCRRRPASGAGPRSEASPSTTTFSAAPPARGRGRGGSPAGCSTRTTCWPHTPPPARCGPLPACKFREGLCRQAIAKSLAFPSVSSLCGSVCHCELVSAVHIIHRVFRTPSPASLLI